MSSNDTYLARLNLNGSNSRERLINTAKNDIKRGIVNSPSYKEVLINDVEQNLVIVTGKSKNTKTFQTLPDEVVNIGDIVVWNSLHWLVTEIDFDDEIYRSGTIVQCNRQIKWQNPITKEIISRWCIAKNNLSNLDENKTATTSEREYKIQLPFDDETIKIDLGKRFMLEKINGVPRTYSIISVDTITNRYEDVNDNIGLITWSLLQDQASQPSDNAELWICNYIQPDSPTPLPDPLLLISQIEGNSTIKLGGLTRTYTAKFYDINGVLDDTVQAVWGIEYPVGFESYFNTLSNANSIQISVVNKEIVLGQKIKLTLSNELYNSCELIVEVIQ